MLDFKGELKKFPFFYCHVDFFVVLNRWLRYPKNKVEMEVDMILMAERDGECREIGREYSFESALTFISELERDYELEFGRSYEGSDFILIDGEQCWLCEGDDWVEI